MKKKLEILAVVCLCMFLMIFFASEYGLKNSNSSLEVFKDALPIGVALNVVAVTALVISQFVEKKL